MRPPENAVVTDLPTMMCWVDEFGIVYTVTKPGDRTIESFGPTFALFKKLCVDGNKLCVLSDMTHSQFIRKVVRGHVDSEMAKYIKAAAIISDSLTGKAIAETFTELTTGPVAVRKFASEEEAREWLKTCL